MEDMKKEWYVVNTYSGHENKVKEKLEMRASSMGMEDYILRVVVPEVKSVDENGKEKTTKLFPGYILVEMIMTDEAWFIVRNTPGVTGFIGSSGKGAKPFPLTPQEVDKILGSMGMSRLQADSDLKIGEKIKVISGAKLEVSIDLFGQETVVELELSQITKA